MLLYKCNSCNESIQVVKARLTCTTCTPPMTLCGNCYLVQDYPEQHQDGGPHSLLLYPHSGHLPVPPPPPVRNQTTIRRKPGSASYSDVPPRKPPRPTVPARRNEPDAALTPSGQSPSQPSTPSPQQQQHNPEQPPLQRQREQPPLQPENLQGQRNQQLEQKEYQYQQEYPQQEHSQQQYQPTGWTSFFNQDMTPTASFISLIEQFFHHLDPRGTGYLSPETYTEYLDACGAPADHNVWKASRARTPHHGFDVADRELADHYTAYSVDFALHPRTPSPTPTDSPLNPLTYLPASQRAIFERMMPPGGVPSLSGGQKPMLSPAGYRELFVRSVLLNPSATWGQINRAMRHYRLPLWTRRGDVPREMLPLAPFQPEVDRTQVMLEGARANAEREMDALKAKLLIEKQGRQNALDLLDDRVYVYR